LATNEKQAGMHERSDADRGPNTATTLVPLTELYSRDDEIDLVDVALVFVRRRVLLLTVWVLITAIGVAVAFIRPRSYDYTAAMSVGQLTGADGTTRPPQSPDDLIAMAQNGFVPAAVQRAQASARDVVAGLANRLKIQNVEKTGVITLQVRASESHQKAAVSFLSGVLDTMMGELQKRIALIKQQIRGQVDGLNAQIKDAQNQLSAVDKAIGSAPGGTRAATLEQRAEALMNQVSSYRAQITSLQLRLRGIQPPEAFRQPQRSAKPVGMGRSVIVVLAFVLGLFLALFACILAEFGGSVRSRLSES